LSITIAGVGIFAVSYTFGFSSRTLGTATRLKNDTEFPRNLGKSVRGNTDFCGVQCPLDAVLSNQLGKLLAISRGKCRGATAATFLVHRKTLKPLTGPGPD